MKLNYRKKLKSYFKLNFLKKEINKVNLQGLINLEILTRNFRYSNIYINPLCSFIKNRTNVSCNSLTSTEGIGTLSLSFSIVSLNRFKMIIKNLWCFRMFWPCFTSNLVFTASIQGATVFIVDDRIGSYFPGSSCWKTYKNK